MELIHTFPTCSEVISHEFKTSKKSDLDNGWMNARISAVISIVQFHPPFTLSSRLHEYVTVFNVPTGPTPDGCCMALIPLAGRSHVLGQLFDVLAPYSGKLACKSTQFPVRQKNILVTAIGMGRVPCL